jgi:HAD superfamily phosphatase (TIGR01668 family)
LRPDQRLDSVFQLDTGALRRSGIRGIIFDLDSTLGPWGFARFDPKILRFLRALDGQGFALGFLSNHGGQGREALQASLDGRPLLFKARKPQRAGFVQLLNVMKLSASEVAVVGDQLFTDIWGAKRLGFFAILVPSVDLSCEPRLMGLRRRIEQIVLHLLARPTR